MACYHCLLGRLDEARVLLKKALGMAPGMHEFATYDEDLEALREEIKLGNFMSEEDDE